MANTQVAKTNQSMASYLTMPAVKNQIEEIVGKKSSQTFISAIVSAVQTNPNLSKCSNTSILSGALLGESLKLTPSPQLGMYYLVPYGSEAQFQLGYKGMIQLAVRSGQYKKIAVSEVKEGELSGYNPITEEFTLTPILDVKKREKAPIIGYYGMFELNNGFRKEIFWTHEQMESHAKRYSKSYKSGGKGGFVGWNADFVGMAKKTILRQLISKWGVMSVEMTKAYEADQAVINEDGSFNYVDNATFADNVQADIKANANTDEFVVDAEEVVIDEG